MIWFTWFQNTMFDVRFSNDSVFERCCKAAQFGIMTGFAITGPGYQSGTTPGSPEAILAVRAFQTLSLILMTSRLILAFQYTVATFWLKSYKKAKAPMIGHIATMFCSAMIFLGLYFGFDQTGSEKVLTGWYLTFIAEAWIVLIISGRTPFLSFRHTVLVERLGLLTLIILGEGIISMSNALNAVGTDSSYAAPIIGQIICCVLVAYLMYMLYFDNVQPERMGSFRQHVWAVLHFPFHASVVLVVEAMAQLTIWQKVVDLTVPLSDAAKAVDLEHPTAEQVNNLKQVYSAIVERFNITVGPTTVYQPDASISAGLAELANATSGEGGQDLGELVNSISNSIIYYICQKFKIDIDPEKEEEAGSVVFSLFEVVYAYFFAFAGLVLIVLSILFLIGKRHKLRGELMGAALRFTAGLTLSLLSLMCVPGGIPDVNTNDMIHNYMYSGMVLPTVLIVYLVG
jgi:low temperature requirement protein LtrA